MTNPKPKPKREWEIEKCAEEIIGRLYCPPPMSPKLLEQEKKKIIPIISKLLEKQVDLIMSLHHCIGKKCSLCEWADREGYFKDKLNQTEGK